MGKKLDRVYDALLDGANDGLVDAELYDFIIDKCPKTPARRIVKASLFALSDPEVREKKVLDAIYGLAIKYRLTELGVDDDGHEDEDAEPSAPLITKKVKRKLESSTADIPM